MLKSYCKKIYSNKIFLISTLIIVALIMIILLWSNKKILRIYNNSITYNHELHNKINEIKRKITLVPAITKEQIDARLNKYSNENKWIEEMKEQLAVIQENNNLNEPFRINIKNPIEIFNDHKGNIIKAQKLEFNVNLNKLDNFIGIVSDIKKILPHNSTLVYCEILDSKAKPKSIYQTISDNYFFSRMVFNIYSTKKA